MKVILSLLLAAAMLLPGQSQAQTSFTLESPTSRSNRWSIPVRTAPNYISGRVLAANVAESISVPATAIFAVFSADCNFYANGWGTATTLTSDINDGTASELNPSAWYLPLGQISTISVIAAAACRVTVSFSI